MTKRLIRHGLPLVAMFLSPLGAREIQWYCDSSSVNLTSDGSAMDAGFQFELGVFDNSFSPTMLNMEDWAANWRPAQRVDYNPASQFFDSEHTVSDNDPPFIWGQDAYIWGWRINGNQTEWILFRDTTWNWPEADPFNFTPLDWNAKDATPVIGWIDADGSPFLMKSDAVSGAASPATSWEQWRGKELAGEPLDGPNDDPDKDGTPNLLEFVFATDPLAPGAPVDTPVEVVTVGDDRFAQITIPRRVEHPAVLTVEVSSDLTVWNSGPAHTLTVSEVADEWIVRDLTPLSPSAPARFMRLKAMLP